MRQLLVTIVSGLCFFQVLSLSSNGQHTETNPVRGKSDFPARRVVECEGWNLHISEDLYEKEGLLLKQALQLLEEQLREIDRVVPPKAVKELRQVPLWISGEYPDTPPRAEYHPDAGWLERNHRDPAMEKGVEFTNVRIFAEEKRRMPNFALHELAHAYHDRVLPNGFANQEIREAYEKAKASGKYDAVEQRFGDGRSANGRAYAMTTPQEYFAECSEAFFSVNDFYPFTLDQLKRHDPEFTRILTDLWGGSVTQARSRSEWRKDCKHSGAVWINTTSDGVQIDGMEEIREFPLCIRLYADSFPFSECQPNGDDIRVYSPSNDSLLAYEIDAWDPKQGFAVLWVRVPKIRFDERQELQLYWGNPGAISESSGREVFNASNGFVTVWHLGETVVDSVGVLQANDTGTRATEGLVGGARRFASGKGICVGTDIANLTTGALPHTSEAWIRVDRPNSTVLGWGNEKAQGKVVMQYRSPSRINMDCYFSSANIATDRIVPLKIWTHVAHTYSPEATRIYIDGKLAREHVDRKPNLNLESPSRFYLGGWYDRYDYEGAIDEVRISCLERSADWIRLQYENQKTHSPLVGTIVSPGNNLALTPDQLQLSENETGMVSVVAQGAEKLYWEIHRDGSKETILTDRTVCSIPAGRVLSDESFNLVVKAVYSDGVRSASVPVAIRNTIPEPERLDIVGPKSWDGRTEMVLQPRIANANKLAESGQGGLNCQWKTSGVAVASRAEATGLILSRAQGDGTLRIDLQVDNGGPAISTTAYLDIRQPPREQEEWIERPVAEKERPRNGQFIPREGRGDSQRRTGKIVYAGSFEDEPKLTFLPERVIVRAFDDSKLIAEQFAASNPDGTYAISLEIPAALLNYRCELHAARGDRELLLHQATDLLCGDVYLIAGQSNAVATDFGTDNDPATSRWVRTYGTTESGRNEALSDQWGQARARGENGALAIGYWGLELGKELSERERIPICILNGAVGGTRIDQHQRNLNDSADEQTICGRLLDRVRQARVSHGVRGIFWYQGENDQGADGPCNQFGFETYESHFVNLAAAWKEDYPNTEHYFVFQIWPKACAMGFDGSDNRLRDVQRRLPRLFSNLSIQSTLGTQPPGGCHYPAEGYAELARRLLPLVKQKIYGREPAINFASPNLVEAKWTSRSHDSIELIFDSPIEWNERCIDQFYIGDQRLGIKSGSAEKNRVALELSESVKIVADKPVLLTYVDSSSWSQDRLLLGSNGHAALTFCDVPISEVSEAP